MNLHWILPILILSFLTALVLSIHFSGRIWDLKIKKEVRTLCGPSPIVTKKETSRNKLSKLPECVQRWMKTSGALEHKNISSIQLKQTGFFRLQPNQDWSPLEAIQYISLDKPGFVWYAKMSLFPGIQVKIRDMLYCGKGYMLGKIFNIYTVVKEDGVEMDQGAMTRFLAEMFWFPSAALNDYITWETVDQNSAKAIFTHENKKVSGFFIFDSEGNPLKFYTDRYQYNPKLKKYILSRWEGHMHSMQGFNNIKIPTHGTVLWKECEGNFSYCRIEIKDVKYNFLN